MEHLLFLAHRIPYPPTKGDKVRSYNLLKYLAARYRVHLGAFIDDAADLGHRDALRGLCEDCYLPRLDTRLARMRSLSGLFSGAPLTLPYYASAGMRRWVAGVLGAGTVRKAVVFSSCMAQYVPAADGLRRVVDLVDVDSDKWRQYAARQPWPYSAIYRREGRTLLGYEREIASGFDATVLVSAAEADLFRRLAPEAAGKVWHANNGVDSDYFSPERAYEDPYAGAKRVLVFTGAMDYRPNVDAVVWFARDIFPAIRRAEPDAAFCIVGARPAAEVTRLAQLPGVRVTGTVPDVRPFLAHAKVAVAPLRMARGVQNKVLEAMAMAMPVLASPQAMEGIDAQVGTEVLVADGEDEYARTALHLLRHDGAAAIGRAGRARVLASYGWEGSLGAFERLLGEGEKASAQRRPAPASRDALYAGRLAS